MGNAKLVQERLESTECYNIAFVPKPFDPENTEVQLLITRVEDPPAKEQGRRVSSR